MFIPEPSPLSLDQLNQHLITLPQMTPHPEHRVEWLICRAIHYNPLDLPSDVDYLQQIHEVDWIIHKRLVIAYAEAWARIAEELMREKRVATFNAAIEEAAKLANCVDANELFMHQAVLYLSKFWYHNEFLWLWWTLG